MVMNREHFEKTEEAYVPQECEHYGHNEHGGMRPPNKDEEEWQDHCGGYRDRGLCTCSSVPHLLGADEHEKDCGVFD